MTRGPLIGPDLAAAFPLCALEKRTDALSGMTEADPENALSKRINDRSDPFRMACSSISVAVPRQVRWAQASLQIVVCRCS